jgi:hypothetical protein
VRISTFITSCILLCSVLTTWGQSAAPELENEEYAIYSQAIANQFVRDGVDRIVVADHTLMEFPPIMMGMTQFGNSPGMQKLRRAMAKETLQDYEKKNKSSVTLGGKFQLKVPVVLISEVERDQIFLVGNAGKKGTLNPNGLDEFHRLYPKSQGFMTLSRIGFNSKKTQALLYIGNLCGGLCGAGEWFLFAKEGNSWKIEYVATVWVS